MVFSGRRNARRSGAGSAGAPGGHAGWTNEERNRVGGEGKPERDPDFLRLVEEYRSLLEEITRCKLSGARLGGEARRRREALGEGAYDERLRELEKRILELRERIEAKRKDIDGLNGRR
jgi:hypothetical protein